MLFLFFSFSLASVNGLWGLADCSGQGVPDAMVCSGLPGTAFVKQLSNNNGLIAFTIFDPMTRVQGEGLDGPNHFFFS